MNIGDEIKFQITGTIATYRGLIDGFDSNGHPRIKVTHVRVPDGWIPSGDWPILKDGDYILR
jgi:hypothetical protein